MDGLDPFDIGWDMDPHERIAWDLPYNLDKQTRVPVP